MCAARLARRSWNSERSGDCGARPLYRSGAFIIEEGFSIPDLSRVIQSKREAADTAGVQLITGY
jgi:hydrogenase maturation factor